MNGMGLWDDEKVIWFLSDFLLFDFVVVWVWCVVWVWVWFCFFA